MVFLRRRGRAKLPPSGIAIGSQGARQSFFAFPPVLSLFRQVQAPPVRGVAAHKMDELLALAAALGIFRVFFVRETPFGPILLFWE